MEKNRSPKSSKADLASSSAGEGGVSSDVQDQNLPPAYGDIFSKPWTPIPSSSPKTRYSSKQDDRNLWEKLHECFEMSICQQIIWLQVLVFSILYIVFGLKYSGQCVSQELDSKGKVWHEEDLTVFIRAEGGFLCATILIVLLIRLRLLVHLRRTQRITTADLQIAKLWDGRIVVLYCGIYIVNFALCVAGATKIIPSNANITKLNCISEFYNFYYYAKIGQLAVFMPYAAYVISYVTFMMHLQKKWFIRRKLRCWVKLLDADQDGVISQDDMMKTNEKLEGLRKLFGARKTALSDSQQEKWWSEHVFKCGPGKDISVHQLVSYMEGIMTQDSPAERAKVVRPKIKKWFNIFTTEDFLKLKMILSEEDFVKFWAVLANIDERHSREMLIKYFPSPLTLNDFREDFVAFLSNPEFLDEYSSRIFNILKNKPDCMCCKV